MSGGVGAENLCRPQHDNLPTRQASSSSVGITRDSA